MVAVYEITHIYIYISSEDLQLLQLIQQTNLAHACEEGFEAPAEMPVGNRGENADHRCFIELVD